MIQNSLALITDQYSHIRTSYGPEFISMFPIYLSCSVNILKIKIVHPSTVYILLPTLIFCIMRLHFTATVLFQSWLQRLNALVPGGFIRTGVPVVLLQWSTIYTVCIVPYLPSPSHEKKGRACEKA